jgi:hypothetical protein
LCNSLPRGRVAFTYATRDLRETRAERTTDVALMHDFMFGKCNALRVHVGCFDDRYAPKKSVDASPFECPCCPRWPMSGSSELKNPRTKQKEKSENHRYPGSSSVFPCRVSGYVL